MSLREGAVSKRGIHLVEQVLCFDEQATIAVLQGFSAAGQKRAPSFPTNRLGPIERLYSRHEE